MMLRVDANDAVPVYEQLRSQIVRMAVVGTLAEGTQLPTIRQLAHDLGLAKGTVAKAYELLETDDVVSTHGRKGTFIAPQEAAPAQERRSELDSASDAYVVTAKQLGSTLEEALTAVRRNWTA